MRMMVLIIAGSWIASAAASICAQESARLVSGRALRDALQAELTLTVRDAVVRDLLHTLQRDTGIPILLDRRIDPNADPGTYAGSLTVAELLRQISVALDSGISFTDDFVYIGPQSAAGRLRTVAELRRQDVTAARAAIDAEVYRMLVANAAASWPRLAQPRQLIVDTAGKCGMEIRNPEAVPYDLWRAADLPAMPFADRATLVLNQFDLTFELDEQGTAIRLVPVPESTTVEQSHRVAARRKEAIEQRWMDEFPDVTITWQGSTAVISATIEQHERLKVLIADP